MTDMLVKLYELKDDWSFIADQESAGIALRKPIGPEKHALLDWVRGAFYEAWASEVDVAMSNSPRTCFVAVANGKFVGFACYDASALGYFGPVGVDPSYRGRGVGRALLLACLLDMKLRGYGYAIIGWAAAPDYYERMIGAMEIPDSSPGIWKTMVGQDEFETETQPEVQPRDDAVPPELGREDIKNG